MDSINSVTSIEENIYSDNKEENGINILETLIGSKDEANVITNKITLNEMISKLNSKEKQIILLRYYRDKTQQEVAKIIGVSQVQISRIEKKILNKMKEEL